MLVAMVGSYGTIWVLLVLLLVLVPLHQQNSTSTSSRNSYVLSVIPPKVVGVGVTAWFGLCGRVSEAAT